MAVNYGDYVVDNQYIIPTPHDERVLGILRSVLEIAQGRESNGSILEDEIASILMGAQHGGE